MVSAVCNRLSLSITANSKRPVKIGYRSDLDRLSSTMTFAYLLASVVLFIAVAFGYLALRDTLEEQSRLNALVETTGEIQLAIKDSVSHLSELKKVWELENVPPRLELKIRRRLDETILQIEDLRKESMLLAQGLSGLQQEKAFQAIVDETPNGLTNQLQQYLAHLQKLATLGLARGERLNQMWLPVEATAANKGRMSRGYTEALDELRILVQARSVQLSESHRNLSLVIATIVFFEALLIFIPLSRMFKRVHQRMQTAHDELYQRANYDAVTGLPYAAGVKSFLRQGTQIDDQSGLVILKINNITNISNKLGPGSMGHFFREFGTLLTRLLPIETLLFRPSDEEFAFVLSDFRAVVSDTSVAYWQKQLTSQLSVGNVVVFPEVSLGCVLGAISEEGLEERLLSARLALAGYTHNEPKIPEYEPSLSVVIDTENELVEQLRDAVLNREFVPFYQIKVDCDSGAPLGMEALCRWVRSDGELVSPAVFIPVAEKTGVISDITWQLLEQIVDDWQMWKSLGLQPGRIAFNAAAMLLHEPDFLAKLSKIIEPVTTNGICPIDLEITENVALSDGAEQIQATLQGVTELGIRVALDDFGTGYASLSSVSGLSVDIVKVDQSFVRNMVDNAAARNMVLAIINFCKTLKKTCVVEGVETEEEWLLCRDFGCDEIQGYYFYKPTPALDVTQSLMRCQQYRAVG